MARAASLLELARDQNRDETKSGNRRFGDEKRRAGGAATIGFVRVAEYRLYGLDGVNKVSSGEWFEADDDETAIEVAKTMMDGHDCELWKGKRFVTRIARIGDAITGSPPKATRSPSTSGAAD